MKMFFFGGGDMTEGIVCSRVNKPVNFWLDIFGQSVLTWVLTFSSFVHSIIFSHRYSINTSKNVNYNNSIQCQLLILLLLYYSYTTSLPSLIVIIKKTLIFFSRPLCFRISDEWISGPSIQITIGTCVWDPASISNNNSNFLIHTYMYHNGIRSITPFILLLYIHS